MEQSAQGMVYWLFGLSGAGKTTLARHLYTQLQTKRHHVISLDADEVRAGLSRDLGFSLEHRLENLRRIAEVSRILLGQGYSVIVTAITPLEEHRKLIGQIIGPNLRLVHVRCTLEVCMARDTKGLYAREAVCSQLLTGISSPFEMPAICDLEINTSRLPVNACAALLSDFASSENSGARV